MSEAALNLSEASASPGSVSTSVVICAYTEDRWDRLVSAVESALTQQPPPAEVLVVVDHNPALHDRLLDRYARDVTVLPNRASRGLSGARNTGVAAASGDVVAFLDDDAAASPGWLASLASAYSSPDVIGVGGTIEPWWDAPRPGWFPREFDWVVGCSYVGSPTIPQQIRNPIGANMSFRRATLARSGGFNEDLGRVGSVPLGCEETELAIRAARLSPGSRILHAPAASVRHHVTPDRATMGYFLRRCWAEGLSKAYVARLAGADKALSTERSYVIRTLPAGVARNLGVAVSARDGWAVARAFAIIAGLAVTSSGYAVGRLRGRASPVTLG